MLYAVIKARVALESVRGEKTVAQLSSEFGVLYYNLIRQWGTQLLDELLSFPTFLPTAGSVLIRTQGNLLLSCTDR